MLGTKSKFFIFVPKKETTNHTLTIMTKSQKTIQIWSLLHFPPQSLLQHQHQALAVVDRRIDLKLMIRRPTHGLRLASFIETYFNTFQ